MAEKSMKEIMKEEWSGRDQSEITSGLEAGGFNIAYTDMFGPGVGPCSGGDYTSIASFPAFAEFAGFARYALIENQIEEYGEDMDEDELKMLKDAAAKFEAILDDEECEWGEKEEREAVEALNKAMSNYDHSFEIHAHGSVTDIVNSNFFKEYLDDLDETDDEEKEHLKALKSKKFDESNPKHLEAAEYLAGKIVERNY